jgi:hypothetical protein
VHLEGIAEKIIVAVPAIDDVVPAVGTTGHDGAIAVEIIGAVPTVDGVVAAVSVALHNHGIAIEDVVTSKAIDGLRSSSVWTTCRWCRRTEYRQMAFH